eukprot:COSAG02_NODE_1199_length_13917_cov_8.278043_1_plen_174_part_00
MPPSLSLCLSVSLSVRGIPRRPLRTSSIVPPLCTRPSLSVSVSPCRCVSSPPPSASPSLSLSLSLCLCVSVWRLCRVTVSLPLSCRCLSVCRCLRLSLPRVSRSHVHDRDACHRPRAIASCLDALTVTLFSLRSILLTIRQFSVMRPASAGTVQNTAGFIEKTNSVLYRSVSQ